MKICISYMYQYYFPGEKEFIEYFKTYLLDSEVKLQFNTERNLNIKLLGTRAGVFIWTIDLKIHNASSLEMYLTEQIQQ